MPLNYPTPYALYASPLDNQLTITKPSNQADRIVCLLCFFSVYLVSEERLDLILCLLAIQKALDAETTLDQLSPNLVPRSPAT